MWKGLNWQGKQKINCRRSGSSEDNCVVNSLNFTPFLTNSLRQSTSRIIIADNALHSYPENAVLQEHITPEPLSVLINDNSVVTPFSREKISM